VTLLPPDQYANDRNLRARQRLWQEQQPPFDLVAWVIGLADVSPGDVVLDVGCGNGTYLRSLQAQGVRAMGADLSAGMLAAAAPHPELVNADVTQLPLRADAVDVVLAPHMLYHVAHRPAAVRELRRVLRPAGRCVVATNGGGHMRALRNLIESAVAETTPGWEMRNPSTHSFSLENGGPQLGTAFASVTRVRPVEVPPVRIVDARIVADYVASIAGHYQHEIARPWAEIVEAARKAVQRAIDTDGVFTVEGDTGAFVCT
jgi:ubiquinone/menaquinone biosynthesis C-methylase UbiE